MPRLGITYDLTGDGKTILKGNYGIFGFNPGPGRDGQRQSERLEQERHLHVARQQGGCAGCVAGDGIYQPGEEGNQTASALNGAILVDPNLFQPTSTQATAFIERQLTEGVGAHFGFVYFHVQDQTATFQLDRPASAYTVPFNVVDKGPDNIQGTADDQNLTFCGIPNSLISGCSATVTTKTATCQYPTTSYLTNTPNDGTYKTVEFSLNKRQSHNYSLSGGIGYTWSNDFPLSASEHAERSVQLRLHPLQLQAERHATTRRGASRSARCTASRTAPTTRGRCRCRRPPRARARSARRAAAA